MGYVLKPCVWTVLLSFLLLNVLFFWKYPIVSFGKGNRLLQEPIDSPVVNCGNSSSGPHHHNLDCASSLGFLPHDGMSAELQSEGVFQSFYPPFSSSVPLTIQGNQGRLGNQMFVFAALYGLSRLNNRNPILMPKNYEALTKYFEIDFPQVKIAFISNVAGMYRQIILYKLCRSAPKLIFDQVNLSTFNATNPWKIGSWLTEQDSSIPPTSNILAGESYPNSFTFFEHVREEIRKIFRFREPFRKYAQDILHHVKRERPWTNVFVCVHVRRGDYLRKSAGGWLRAFDGREVDIPYFEESVQYFRNKFRNVTFLAVSEDRNWTRDNLSHLGILTVSESESPGHDLALLSSCNHTIITYGTYGFWGGYLAGGEVVYFKDFLKPGSSMSKMFENGKMYPDNWIGISTTPEGFWDNYTNPFLT